MIDHEKSIQQMIASEGDHMENQKQVEVKLEMDMADFSGKVIKRMDINNMAGRVRGQTAGVAIVMSFTDGSTATMLIKAGDDTHITVSPYLRPRMDDYTIVPEDSAVPA